MSELPVGKDMRRRLCSSAFLIWPLLVLLLIERLLLFRQFGLQYSSGSDDIAYMEAGLWFAKTGMISMWGHYPSAMIMPGMPVVIGFFAYLLGEGDTFLLALRLLWILMGVTTAYAAYKAAELVADGWAGIFAAAGFLLPNMAWMNHVILTETPYMLFSTLCLYYTFAMGQRDEKRWFFGYVLCFMAALMFRSNILPMLLFTAVWLLFKRKGRLLLRRALPFALALLLFVVPWGLRNYRCFDAFVPLTYGVGNPLLLGTYQGTGYPTDEELDYDTQVYAPMRERYAAYYKEPEPWGESELDYYKEHFDPLGEVRDLRYAQYLHLQQDGLKARYRLREWWSRDPGSLLKSYLLIKPRWMLNWAWSWEAPFRISYPVLHRLSQVNMLICFASVILSLRLKRWRLPMLFVTAVYAAQVFLYASAFVSDRYASTLMNLRFILAGFGLALLLEWLTRRKRA